MKRRLINERIEFQHDKWRGRGERRWYVDNELHRNDNGPAYENVKTGYFQWWEHGMFMRDNR